MKKLVSMGILLLAACLTLYSQTAKLTVTSTPSGAFLRGDAGGDSFTLTVTNTGDASTNAPVILYDNLSAGLTPVSISGSGWTCTLIPLRCTRSDALAPSQSYAQIILAVNVSNTTEPKVTNTVTVIGGGQTDTSGSTSTEEIAMQPLPKTAAVPPPDEECTVIRQKAKDNGYNVLYYDARTGRTEWAGIHKYSDTTIGLVPFLPVAYTKEQIMVEVCGLKFDTAVNVSLASIAVPESGADIRGTTPTTTVSTVTPGSSTDILQTVNSATNNALAATLPPSATPVTLSSNSLVTPWSTSGGKSTTTAIGATAEDFFRTFKAYDKDAKSTLETIQAICLDKSTTCPRVSDSEKALNQSAYGTTWDVNARALKLYRDITQLAGAPDSASNTGSFDNAKAEAQQFSTVLAALDSQVALANLGTRAAALAATYRALAGNLSTVEKIYAVDLEGAKQKYASNIKAELTAAEDKIVQLNKAKKKDENGIKTAKQTVDADKKKLETAIDAPPCPYAPPAAPATPDMQDLEYQDYCNLQLFHQQITQLGIHVNANGEIDGATTPTSLYQELATLRNNLQTINHVTNLSFAELNSWYERSHVVYTDTLTPSTTNLAVRIGINATEMFVPFTLNFSTSASPAGTSSSSTAAAGHYESSTPLLIQRHTNFNFVGGFLTVHVPTTTNSLIPSSVSTPAAGTSFSPCGGSSTVTVPSTGTVPTYYCPVAIDSTQWQVAGIAALDWFPWGRNYYPSLGHYHSPRSYRSMFGLLVGTSVTNLGTGFGGVSVEPKNGISFYAGLASAHSQRLPSGGGTSGNIYTSSTITPISTLHAGFSAGIGFDFSVFTQIFKGTSSPTAP